MYIYIYLYRRSDACWCPKESKQNVKNIDLISASGKHPKRSKQHAIHQETPVSSNWKCCFYNLNQMNIIHGTSNDQVCKKTGPFPLSATRLKTSPVLSLPPDRNKRTICKFICQVPRKHDRRGAFQPFCGYHFLIVFWRGSESMAGLVFSSSS